MTPPDGSLSHGNSMAAYCLGSGQGRPNRTIGAPQLVADNHGFTRPFLNRGTKTQELTHVAMVSQMAVPLRYDTPQQQSDEVSKWNLKCANYWSKS